MGIVIKAEDD